MIRRDVLERLPETARGIFPSNNGLFIKPPADGDRLPEYTFMAELHSFEPVKPEYDCTSLIFVWFGETIAADFDKLVAHKIRSVDWNQYAADGNYLRRRTGQFSSGAGREAILPGTP
jgi:hypothetical protein